MPRRRAAPRLYLDPGRRQWVIRDGASFVRTGCVEDDRRGAEKRLIEHLGQKHRPWRGAGENPLIADVLVAYASEHLPHTVNAKQASYSIAALGEWWAGKRLGDVTGKACRAYAEANCQSWARKNLNCCEPQFDIGTANTAPCLRFLLLSCPRRRSPATDGSHVAKRRGYCARPGEYHTSRASSCSGSIPAAGRTSCLRCNGIGSTWNGG